MPEVQKLRESSLDGARRNPGIGSEDVFPGFSLLHPGYASPIMDVLGNEDEKGTEQNRSTRASSERARKKDSPRTPEADSRLGAD